MIRKLRIKIVLVIVLVAAVMLGVIFGDVLYDDPAGSARAVAQHDAGHRANPSEPIPPGQSRQVRLPYFVLRTDAFGNLVAIGSTDYDLTGPQLSARRRRGRFRVRGGTSARSRPTICASAAWTAA